MLARWIGWFIGVLMVTNVYANSALVSKKIEYTVDNTKMESVLVYEGNKTKPVPGIIIVPDWMGVGPFAIKKAEKLAGEGYIVLVADVFGENDRPKDTKAASELVAKFKNDRSLLRQRMRAAFDTLVSQKNVDPHKIVVMGYCFGGMAALELARSGAPVVGTVSFHGLLSSPTPEDAKNIKGSVLVLHGEDDPFVPPAEVKAFKEAMRNAGVDTVFVAYSGTVHAFTNPDAGNDKSTGAAYNAESDKYSWAEFEDFLKTVFGKTKN